MELWRGSNSCTVWGLGKFHASTQTPLRPLPSSMPACLARAADSLRLDLRMQHDARAELARLPTARAGWRNG